MKKLVTYASSHPQSSDHGDLFWLALQGAGAALSPRASAVSWGALIAIASRPSVEATGAAMTPVVKAARTESRKVVVNFILSLEYGVLVLALFAKI